MKLFGLSLVLIATFFLISLTSGPNQELPAHSEYSVLFNFLNQQGRLNTPSAFCRLQSEIGNQAQIMDCLVRTYHYHRLTQKIKVAIIDSGIDATHPYLKGYVSQKSYSATNTNAFIDNQGHGTHVAGVFLTQLETLFDYYHLVAPIEIVAAKYFESSPSPSFQLTAVLANLNLNETGLDAINVSSTGDKSDLSERREFEYTTQVLKIPVFAAAGNNGLILLKNYEAYPCMYRIKNLFCVGNLEPSHKLFPLSNFGHAVQIYDVGTNIISSYPIHNPNDAGIAIMTGTSQATPRTMANMVFMKKIGVISSFDRDNLDYTRTISSHYNIPIRVIKFPEHLRITSSLAQ